MDRKHPSPSELIQALSPADFLSLGADQIAYVRPTSLSGREGWTIVAADGQTLSVHLTESAAIAAARQRDLRPVRVH